MNRNPFRSFSNQETADFHRHAALAFFASAWNDEAEETGNSKPGEVLDMIPANHHATAKKALDMAHCPVCGEVNVQVHDASLVTEEELEKHGDPASCTRCGAGGMNWLSFYRYPADIDPEAVDAADVLLRYVCRSFLLRHVCRSGLPISLILSRIDEFEEKGDRPLNAEMFGWYAAMQAMGHGVGIGDAFGSEARKFTKSMVPHIEFTHLHLSREYFTKDDPC